MEFYLWDNAETYNNRFPFNGVERTRIDVEDIYIPESGAFWFRTNHNHIEKNVNLNKRYLHLHSGLTQFETMRFDKEPHKVKRSELFYNLDNKNIEIRKPKRFWGYDVIFKKRCTYVGKPIKSKSITILGEILYDMSENSLHFIMNYYDPSNGIKFHWEEEDEPPTMEQRMRVTELEKQIAELESLSAKNPS